MSILDALCGAGLGFSQPHAPGMESQYWDSAQWQLNARQQQQAWCGYQEQTQASGATDDVIEGEYRVITPEQLGSDNGSP